MTVNHTYAKPGIYTVTMYNNATVKDATKSKTLATITVVNAKDVKKDGYAFVYEYIYVEDATTLTKYSEGTNPTAVKQIAGTKGLFYLTESVVGGQYGAYYYKGAPSSTSPGEYIYIWYPELTIQAELTDPVTTWGATAGDSIDGKTINKDTNVTFLVNTPMVGPANVNDRFDDLAVKIVFTTPVGGKTTVFGTLNNGAVANYDDVLVTATQNVAGSAIPGIDAVAGTYTAQAEFINYAPFANNAEKSNTISFTVQSTTLVVTAAEDSVIRSNPFTITISGNANAYYNVTIQNPETEGAKNPFFQLGQNGMKNPIQKDAIVIGYQFTTDASGQRTVQFNTNEFTEDKTFTIRVTEAEENAEKTNANWDEVKVKVEKGAVTISASGDGSYYIGSEITLSGTNTDSDTVYLFITGPNLNPNGVKLLDLDKDATNGGSEVAVKTDKTWEKKWNTAGSGLDTGAYTIYATSTDVGKNSLSETEYATVSVSLKQPFLSAVPSGTIVAKGDDLYIRGTAEGEPNELKIYIFGPNKFKDDSVNVEDDGTYEKKIKIDSDWASNQYFVVIQHPMYNGEFDADLNKTDKNAMFFYIKNTDGTTDQASFYVTAKNKLQGSNAADALTKMIDNANIDDIYTKLTFTVTEPRIDITNPGDRAVGSTFTISGTTNLAVDDQIIVEVQEHLVCRS